MPDPILLLNVTCLAIFGHCQVEAALVLKSRLADSDLNSEPTHRPMPYDAGRPRSVIRLSVNTSRCTRTLPPASCYPLRMLTLRRSVVGVVVMLLRQWDPATG